MPSPSDPAAPPNCREPRLPWLFAALLVLLLALVAWQWRHGPPLSANLLDLLPPGSSDALVQQAERRVQEPLNSELVVLLHHPDESRAQALTDELGKAWQAAGPFSRVQWQLDADLPALRRQLLDGRLALLPAADRRQLLEQPQAFVEQRVRDLFDPFAATGLLAAEQDWFGLAARIQRGLPGAARLQPAADGGLVAEHAGKRWRLLRLRARSDAFDLDLPLAVAGQLEAARLRVQDRGGELLATGGLLHAAYGQRQARLESGWIGGLSAAGTLLLILLLFRRARLLLALLPALVGALAGLTACIALFGQIHVLTLVLGASLVGVSLDFPLHYLSKSWALQPWQPWPALRATLPGLTLGLLTNVIGYLALALTPFPALAQVALFSSVGLLAAWLCTVCLLPALLGRQPLRPWTPPLRLAARLLVLRDGLQAHRAAPWLLAALVLLCLAGIARLSFKDDLRQWVGSSPQLLADARAIGQILDFQPTSQFFLVRGADERQLLQRQAQLTERLDRWVASGQLRGYLALSQLLAPASEQQRLRQALPTLAQAGAPLLALGVPAVALQAELAQLQALPEQDIEQALAGPLGEPWRHLWLGANADGVAALVSLHGLADSSLLQAEAAGLDGVQLVDRPAELNRLFAATQQSALLLKLLACALIFLLLCLPFGWRGAVRVLGVSLLAALAALGGLGWLGQPLTLFALFGLLLVTAIGVDYAILMREQVGGAATSLLGTLLAAVTTWLSFGLLTLSSTPAIASFGLTVSLGLVFSFLLAPWAATPRPAPQP